ncbi:hypothetical protein D6856_08260 [Butyrivibrio sp. XB500-5]|uniref:hypothetical protein n=1 Tax=Butyrivibrio sp. XB500-5 TaxID=2364880 RepID=UPI000EA96449|nr:hypothetical protein [Butyrivibrio sp. XB500-5]RKM60067.1 hypothetical protein D6856_08260 [Butyrivibrio sp. XB500-5]
MSKGSGFGKFILFCATVGAAAAGVYYYLTKREAEIADSFDDDDFEEFDDFDDDELTDSSETRFGSRKYVDISSKEADEPLDSGEPSSDDKTSSEEFFDDEDEQ